MTDKADPSTLAAVARDFVWVVCSVGHACVEDHEHTEDQCVGEFPYPSPTAFDSMYGVASHIDAEIGLDDTVWRVIEPHMWEVDDVRDGKVVNRYFINYEPVGRARPEGFLLSEADQRLGRFGHQPDRA